MRKVLKGLCLAGFCFTFLALFAVTDDLLLQVLFSLGDVLLMSLFARAFERLEDEEKEMDAYLNKWNN